MAHRSSPLHRRLGTSLRWSMLSAVLPLVLPHGAFAQTPPPPGQTPPPGAPPAGALPPGAPPAGALPPGGPPQQARPKQDLTGPEKASYADAAALVLRMSEDPAPTEAQKIVGALPVSPMAAMSEPPELRPDAPQPSANPRDFSGVWFHDLSLHSRILRDKHGKLLPFTMAGAKVLERRAKGEMEHKPYQNAAALCRPPGLIWQADVHMPFAIYQNKDAVEFVFMDYRGRLSIALDPKLRPAGDSYMGYAVGHWDGDTLVAETRGLKQGLWLDISGTPVSKDAHLTYRIRKINEGDRNTLIEIETTVDDPKYYTNPWTIVRTFRWQPNLVLFDEYNCELQIGDPSTKNDAGLVAEPAE